jgi:hypothetical protein
MKNLEKLPVGIQDAVSHKRWTCSCGQSGLGFSVTKNAKVQGHCFSCGLTVFFNDVGLFACKDGPWSYQEEHPVTKNLSNKKGKTSWYPVHRVRTFWGLK